jgi:predicted transcriptional regulator
VARKVQVVLDDETYRLLEELAHPRAGNKSFVVREAVRYFADRETVERALDAILARRETREAMESGIAAWKRGSLVPNERATQRIRRKRGR